MRIAPLVAAWFLAATCAWAQQPPGNADSFAPTPYTAEQIRASCKPGHTLVFRMEVPGQPVITRTTRFLEGNEEGAEFESSAVNDRGQTVEPLHKGRARWEDFRRHAQFPSDRTQLSDAKITVPAGTFDTTLYAVRGDNGEVTKFHFARNLPGPPVLMITEKDGAPLRTMTLTSVKD